MGRRLRSATRQAGRTLPAGRAQSTASATSQNVELAAYYVLLAAITLAALGQVYHNQFICLDDQEYITDNAHVSTGLSFANFKWAFTTFHNGFWHPMTWLSLQLDASLFGLNRPWGFFLTNLLLHLANVLLLFHVLRRMTGALARSVLVAALFAIHPMRVESVAWATERKDVLFAFFWLLGLWAYVHYAARPSWQRYLVVVLAMFLSLMAKPMAVTFPCVVLLLDYWPLKRLAAGVSVRRLLLEKAPLLALGLAFGVLTICVQSAPGETSFPIYRRLLHSVIFYGWYVFKTLAPFELGLYYPYPLVKDLWWRTTAALLVLAGGTLIAWRWRRREPALIVGWLWFLGTLVPVIIANPADRFTYLPHIGLFIALVWGIADLADFCELVPEFRWGLSAIVLAGYGCLTVIQASYWTDELVLWQRVVAIHGGFMPRVVMAETYLKHGNGAEALKCFEEALTVEPDHGGVYKLPGVHNTIGALLWTKKNDPLAGKDHFEMALKLNPNYADAHRNLGLVLSMSNDKEGAIDHFLQAVANKPDFADAQRDLDGAIDAYLREAESWLSQGRVAEARRAMVRLLELLPAGHPARSRAEKILAQCK